jgi:succinate dehydrogenase / fumarate reductase cytochrome b subunit
MQSSVESPWLYAFYLLGIVSATFHLANGIWSFSIVWGLTVGPRAQRRMMWVSAAVFLILSFIGIRSIEAFRA